MKIALLVFMAAGMYMLAFLVILYAFLECFIPAFTQIKNYGLNIVRFLEICSGLCLLSFGGAGMFGITFIIMKVLES